MDLSTGSVGPETTYDVAFTGGALAVTLKYTGAQASLSLVGNISAAQLIAALSAKLTNPTEKAVLAVVESIITAIP